MTDATQDNASNALQEQAALYNPLLSRFGVEIALTAERGRGLVATRALKAGDVVLCEQAFAAVVHKDSFEFRCCGCFGKLPEQKLMCGQCKTSRYCTRACQKLDWPDHKKECTTIFGADLSKFNTAQLADAMLLGRVFRRAARSSAEAPTPAALQVEPLLGVTPIQARFADVELMHSQFDPKAKLTPRMMSDVALADVAKKWFNLPDSSGLAVAAMLSRFTSNNFGVADDLLSLLGSGVFPFGAVINHSCDHNVLHGYVFTPRGPVQQWRLLRDVEAGTELTHCYVDLGETVAQRQQKLQANYGFTCACALCAAPNSERERVKTALRSGEQQPSLDADPNAVRRGELVEANRLERAASVMPNGAANFERETLALARCLEKRLAWLHPWHNDVVRGVNLIANLQLISGDFFEALKSYKLLADAYSVYYGKMHPLVGINLSILGEIEANLKRPDATKHLKQAYRIAVLTRGKESEVALQIGARLQQLLLEAQNKKE